MTESRRNILIGAGIIAIIYLLFATKSSATAKKMVMDNMTDDELNNIKNTTTDNTVISQIEKILHIRETGGNDVASVSQGWDSPTGVYTEYIPSPTGTKFGLLDVGTLNCDQLQTEISRVKQLMTTARITNEAYNAYKDWLFLAQEEAVLMGCHIR